MHYNSHSEGYAVSARVYTVLGREWGERINRNMFWGATAALTCWAIALSLIILALAFSGDHNDRDSAFILDYAGILLLIFWFLMAAFWTIRIVVPRLHDFGAPGWPAALVLLPIVGWFILAPLYCIYCGVAPGDQSGNKFGPASTYGGLALWWWALAGLLAGAVILGIVFVIS